MSHPHEGSIGTSGLLQSESPDAADMLTVVVSRWTIIKEQATSNTVLSLDNLFGEQFGDVFESYIQAIRSDYGCPATPSNTNWPPTIRYSERF